MKKYYVIYFLCFALLFSGCSAISQEQGSAYGDEKKYQRISFDLEVLDETLSFVNENTVVVNDAKETFPTQFPIYEITPHNITQQEFDETVKALNLNRISENIPVNIFLNPPNISACSARGASGR